MDGLGPIETKKSDTKIKSMGYPAGARVCWEK